MSTFTDKEVRGAIHEAKLNLRYARSEWQRAALTEAGDAHVKQVIYREALVTVAALNHLRESREGRGR